MSNELLTDSGKIAESGELASTNAWAEYLWLVSITMIGSLLITAGAGKIISPQPMSIGAIWEMPSTVTFAIGIFEMGLGALTIFGLAGLRLWLTLMSTFSLYVVVLGINGKYGAVTCPCLAGSSIAVSRMVGLDIAILLYLWFARSRWLTKRETTARGIFGGKLVAVLPLTTLALFAFFGSLPSALAYFSGATVVARMPHVHIGSIAVSSSAIAEFDLRNFSDEPVKLVGAKTSCSCTVAEGLPLIIPAGGSGKLQMRLTGRAQDLGKIATYAADIAVNGVEKPMRVSVAALVVESTSDSKFVDPFLGVENEEVLE